MKKAVCAIVAAQYLAIAAIEFATGFRYWPPFLTYFLAALCLAIFALGGLAIVRVLRLAKVGGDHPGYEILTLLKTSEIPLMYFLVAAQFAVLGWLKSAMPFSVGFHYDEVLARIDATLFGADPWTLLTWLPGPFLDRVYITWAWSTIVVMLILPILPKTPRRDTAILSYFIVMAFASLGQYLVPSAGPIFYERLGLGDRFVALPTQTWVETTANYLWSNYQVRGENIGVGISAFPSLHVAGAAWVAVVVSSYSRIAAPFAWLYFSLIFFGSIILGWHYAVDGIAGLLGAILAHRLARWYFIQCSGSAPSFNPDQQQLGPTP